MRTKFHVAACENCKASMTVTEDQFWKLHHNITITPEAPFCLHLFDSLKCCDNPFFLWVLEAIT